MRCAASVGIFVFGYGRTWSDFGSRAGDGGGAVFDARARSGEIRSSRGGGLGGGGAYTYLDGGMVTYRGGFGAQCEWISGKSDRSGEAANLAKPQYNGQSG